MAAPTLRGLFPARIPISPTGLPHCFENRPALRLFRIARLITSNGLRILCYHGFALADEYKYRGTLFIKDELFSRCMGYLKRNNYPILSLNNALDGAEQRAAAALHYRNYNGRWLAGSLYAGLADPEEAPDPPMAAGRKSAAPPWATSGDRIVNDMLRGTPIEKLTKSRAAPAFTLTLCRSVAR
ncbi:MAG: hypothetical protein ACJ8AH_08660 [Stellaceae bacterium]